VEAEQRDERVAADLLRLAGVRVLHRHRLDLPVPMDLAHLVRREDPDPAFLLELACLVHRGLERAEPVTAVDESDRMRGGVLQAERPVERRVAAADDDAARIAEDLLLAHEVVEASALPLVDPVDDELARLERSVSGGDDQRAREVRAALVGRDREQLLAVLVDPLERLHLLAQVHLRAVLEALLGAAVDELLGQDLRIAGDVVDVLLRIHGGDLPAELLEALDDADCGVAVARVVRGGKPARACAENGDVDDGVRRQDSSGSSRSRSHRRCRRALRPPPPGTSARSRRRRRRSDCRS
jgi:hypothetical protein